ncbi:MAG: glycosylase [Lachnospiraceae bacterium]|nr:glycosylase [Lachnospiraceae bacterium]
MNKNCNWLENAVFYEIYPQSFKDTDGDGIGNINGITENLEYIKGLGCNAIWINPCFDSPFGDAGYDVSDYYKVAPRYGTNDDLAALFDEAHKLGIHILLDLVPGHTSWDHPWFKESMKAEKNEYTDRYIWTDNIWESPEGYGSLRGISDRDGSCLVNFFSHQPALNYGFYKPDRPWQQPMDSEGAMATRNEVKNIMRFWLSKGCDGFRVDMAGAMVKNDENGKGTIALWQDIRSFLNEEFPEAVLVSEWGEPDKSIEAGFHMDFLLHFGPSHYNDLFRCDAPFFCGKGDASLFVKKYLESYQKADGNGFICIPSGNHDMDRLRKYVDGDLAKMAFAFLLSMPGAPYIYYGDEIGMRYIEGLTSVEGGYNRTGSRSPMQWNRDLNAGFSTKTYDKTTAASLKNGSCLYVPIDPDEDRPNVADQLADENSLLNEVKKLISVRQSHKALMNSGEIEFLCDGAPGKPLVYVRSSGEEQILAAVNPTDNDYELEIPEFLKKTAIEKQSDIAVSTIYNLGNKPVLTGTRCIIKARSTFFI